jgi:Ca2+-binding RTX toxin-like protein
VASGREPGVTLLVAPLPAGGVVKGGTSGNDALTGSGGDDRLDGGAGADTLAGPRAATS